MTGSRPYSIRLSDAQRGFIREQARAVNMSDAKWIRYRLFSNSALTKPAHTVQQPLSHDKDLARILYLLGQSRMANNLNQIAKAVNMGTLIISPDIYSQIDESYRAIIGMRSSLIKALGLRGE